MTSVLTKPVITDPNPGPYLKILPMEDVLKLPSGDAGFWTGENYGPVESVVKYKRDSRYDWVKKQIEAKGFAVGGGVRISSGDYAGEPRGPVVWNGHHRIVALLDLGAKWVPVFQESEYEASMKLPESWY